METIVDHGTWQLDAADEGPYQPGSELLSNESYYFDVAGDLSGAEPVRLALELEWRTADSEGAR